MGDLELTSALGMLEPDGAKMKDNPSKKEKKTEDRLRISNPEWINTSVRYRCEGFGSFLQKT